MRETANETRRSPGEETFIPALGRDWLTPIYDVVSKLIGERALKQRLVAQADIAPGHDVLDLGCGTGSLLLLVKEACPLAEVTGVDIDPRILGIARGKLDRAGVRADLVQGSAIAPPLPAASFDRVLTTLMLHPLTTAKKHAALASAHALLRPGGELHIADWGKPQNVLMRVAALSFTLADGVETTGDNVRGELPAMVRAAGFTDVRERDHRMTPLGTLSYISARRG